MPMTTFGNMMPNNMSSPFTNPFGSSGDIRGDSTAKLRKFSDFGDNPGALHAFSYVPKALTPDAALVVVLHGCTQHAAGYDRGSGWSQLADRHGFALLFPEQTRSNNPNLCFNWFQPKDMERGQGEAASIAAMIAAMVDRHGIDPARVHITGLSAGGAMTASMLAAYPELFASGAIIAGLPHGVARNVPQALDAMAGRGIPEGAALADRVRGASDHRGDWPRVSVWQGDADSTVVPSNGAAVAAQWRDVHGLAQEPMVREQLGRHRRSAWTDAKGHTLVELYEIAGMGHGVPLRPGKGDDEAGEAGAHMLDAGIDSTGRIATFFGLTDQARASKEPAKARGAAPLSGVGASGKPAQKLERIDLPDEPLPEKPHGVQAVIEKALRSAGLM